jgi:hypothetical protein
MSHRLTQRDLDWLKKLAITIPVRVAAESAEYDRGWRDRDILAAEAQKTFIEDVTAWQADNRLWRRIAFIVGVYAAYLTAFLILRQTG